MTTRHWTSAVATIALVISLPVLGVLSYAASEGSPSFPRGTGSMTVTTLSLLLGVGIGTTVLGTGLAWLVSAHEFPGRRHLSWMLVLPLAMPAYILGFVFLSFFEFAGPAQTALRTLLGDDFGPLPVRSIGGAIVVMTLTLYPYVYLMTRAAFLQTGSSSWDAARTLGASRARAFAQVVLPLSRPALAAGLALVTMETMTDFATVQYFTVKTVSVGVYLTWKGSYDLGTAIWLTLIVLSFAIVLLGLERTMRGRARFSERAGGGRGLERLSLHGRRKWAATVTGFGVVAIAFILPVAQLLWWGATVIAERPQEVFDVRFAEYLTNSVGVAVVVALVCVAISLVLAHTVRIGGGRLVRWSAQATTLGYAIPGAVIGIGVLVVFSVADDILESVGVPGGTGILLTGSIAAILFSYIVRFTAPAWQSVDASFQRIPESVSQSAATLGAKPGRILRRVHLPMVRPGVAVALTLVLIDVIKELPLVLMLRPVGFSTLSVWVYQLARENFWELAALPALLIVLVALVPVAVLTSHRRIGES